MKKQASILARITYNYLKRKQSYGQIDTAFERASALLTQDGFQCLTKWRAHNHCAHNWEEMQQYATTGSYYTPEEKLSRANTKHQETLTYYNTLHYTANISNTKQEAPQRQYRQFSEPTVKNENLQRLAIHREQLMIDEQKNRRDEYIRSNSFLNSFEWKELRILALAKYGNRCQCCGNTPKSGTTIHVDHIKPRQYYPELALDINNLQILCNQCNHGKSSKLIHDWR